MLNAIRDSLSDRAKCNNEEDGEHDEFDEKNTGPDKLSEEDDPLWVMGAISKSVLLGMERFWPRLIKFDDLAKPGSGDTAYYFHERNSKYRTAELEVAAVGKPQTETDAATSAVTTFAELVETLDIFPGKLQMPEMTS